MRNFNILRKPSVQFSLILLLLVGSLSSLLINSKTNFFTPIEPRQEDLYRVKSDGSSHLYYGRERPSFPTLVVLSSSNATELENRLSAAMTTVFANFDNVSVLRTAPDPSLGSVWPEDYQLLLSTMALDENILITAQLQKLTNGLIVHSQSMQMPLSVRNQFTASQLKTVEEFAARLVQYDGALMRSYFIANAHSPLMACYFSIDPINAETITWDIASNEQPNTSPDSNNCATQYSTAELDDGFALLLNAKNDLLLASQEQGLKRNELIASAEAKSRQALAQAPFKSSMHTQLMQVLSLQSKQREALKIGQQAMRLNPYDGRLLKELSALNAEMKRDGDAKQLLSQAERVSADFKVRTASSNLN